MNSEQKILNLLTICRKASKLVIGFDAVCEEIKKGNAKSVLLANDISPKTKKEIDFYCSKADITVETAPFDKEQIRLAIGKSAAVIAVCDDGFAKRFTELLNEVGLNDK